MEQDINSRLREFISSLGISCRKFEVQVGLSNGAVNKIKDTIRDKTIYRISAVYPQLNLDWLRFGKGEMLTNPNGGGYLPHNITAERLMESSIIFLMVIGKISCQCSRLKMS